MPRNPHIEVIARALIVVRGQILVCRNLKRGNCFLPGGHVEFGEPARTALARELMEEAGLRVRIGPLAFSAEHAFRRRSARSHELLLMFHVEHARKSAGARAWPVIRSREAKIGFEWVPIDGLARARFIPGGLIGAVEDAVRARRGSPGRLVTVRPWARA